MAVRLFSGIVLLSLSTLIYAPPIPDFIPEAGIVAEKQGEWEKAISIYLESLLANNRNITLWLRVAALEYKLKNYTLALNAYHHALQLEPNQPLIHKRISEIYAEINQPQEALQEINKAIALTPDNSDYYLAKAQLANWIHDEQTALESYQNALMLKKIAHTNEDPVELLMQIARLQNQLHNYPAAIEHYKQIIRLKPSAAIYQALSQNYAAANMPAQALTAINAALQIEPDNIEFLQAKAMLATWLKNSALAMETYQQILKLLPDAQKIQAIINNIVNSSEKSSNTIAQDKGTVYPLQAQKSPPLPTAKFTQQATTTHNYLQMANSIKQAIKQHPHNAVLYKKLSETYAVGQQPQQALNAINQALAIMPNNINYLRSRAKLAAWANDKIQMQNSYERILQLKPLDEDALLNLAFSYAWQGKTDKALAAYRYFLNNYPQNAAGWIQYGEALSWIESYKHSLNALERYRQLGGEQNKYLRVKARVLSVMGRYQSAQLINNLLLQKNPNDPYLLSTQATLLNRALQTKKSVATLKLLEQTHPDYFQLEGLKKVLLTPLRSTINLGANYTSASDTTRIMQIPTLVGQYFITPATSLLVQGLYERAIAASYSELNTIDGNNSIFDESMMLGLTTQIPAIANFKGLAGALKIQGKNTHFIYNLLANTNIGETTQLTIENSYNLYRPYLIPQSPRLISLQIMEQRIGGTVQWQPFIQNYLNVQFSHSTLSDDNAYWHLNLWPKKRIYSSQKWQITMGINGDSWNYQKRAINKGYYAPLHFQSYQGTVDAYYAISENIGYSISGGFGIQKDETFPHYFYGEDLATQLYWGIFTDWELKINAAYTLRMNPDGSYRCWTSGIILTRRF